MYLFKPPPPLAADCEQTAVCRFIGALSLIRTLHSEPLSSFSTQNVGILIQNTRKCLMSKQYNGNIVNKAVKDTRLE